MLQGKFPNLDRDLVDWKRLQQMCCEAVRRRLDEVNRLILNEPLRLLGYDCIINRFADFVRHIARFPTWPERNVDR